MGTQIVQNSYQSEIDQIVGDLFRTMLGTEASPTEEEPPLGEEVITSVIAFAGEWKGDLVLECHRTQAHSFAKRFLQSEDIDESSEDVPSTIAELANIIAGNLKVVLPTGVNMGTPSTIEGKDYTVRICGGTTLCKRAFVTDAGAFLLRLIEAHPHMDGKR
ncbi:MAG: chemotaxis protein CheX [Terriglobales bacterium]|jgi:CheY-specific phosphatase CheX